MSTFGKRMRERRLELEMTLDQLDEATAYPRSVLSSIETGRVEEPSPSAAKRIADALQTTPGWLYGLTERKSPLTKEEIHKEVKQAYGKMVKEDVVAFGVMLTAIAKARRK